MYGVAFDTPSPAPARQPSTTGAGGAPGRTLALRLLGGAHSRLGLLLQAQAAHLQGRRRHGTASALRRNSAQPPAVAPQQARTKRATTNQNSIRLASSKPLNTKVACRSPRGITGCAQVPSGRRQPCAGERRRRAAGGSAGSGPATAQWLHAEPQDPAAATLLAPGGNRLPCPLPSTATTPACLQQAQRAHDAVQGQVVGAGGLVLSSRVQPHRLAPDVDHWAAAGAALGSCKASGAAQRVWLSAAVVRCNGCSQTGPVLCCLRCASGWLTRGRLQVESVEVVVPLQQIRQTALHQC